MTAKQSRGRRRRKRYMDGSGGKLEVRRMKDEG
jgi:hypothetical protein